MEVFLFEKENCLKSIHSFIYIKKKSICMIFLLFVFVILIFKKKNGF